MRNFKVWLENERTFHSTRELATALSEFLIKTKVVPTNGHYVEADGASGIKFYSTGLNDAQINKALSGLRYYLQDLGVEFSEQGWEKPDPQDTDYNHYKFSVQMSQYDKTGYGRVKNPELKRRLERGEVLDVRELGLEIEKGVFKLTNFVPDHDYADSKTGEWIGSIAREKTTGDIYASFDTRFYSDEDYEMLWMR